VASIKAVSLLGAESWLKNTLESGGGQLGDLIGQLDMRRIRYSVDVAARGVQLRRIARCSLCLSRCVVGCRRKKSR